MKKTGWNDGSQFSRRVLLCRLFGDMIDMFILAGDMVTALFLVCHTSNIPGKHMGNDRYPSSSFRFLTNI